MDEPTRDDAVDDQHDGAAPADPSQNPASSDDEPSALLSRLRVIEDQPLEARAESLAQLHDELRAQLEAGDATRSHA
jgi:hypothetical protein